MKNLPIRDGSNCRDVAILSSMFVAKHREHTVTVGEYTAMLEEAKRSGALLSPPLYLPTSDGAGILVRRARYLELLSNLMEKIAGVRLAAIKPHVDSRDSSASHVYVHFNNEPFYRAVIHLTPDTVSICSPHINSRDLSRRTRGWPVPGVPGADSDNGVSRPDSLKNLRSDVCAIIRKVCAATPVSVGDFEMRCFESQSGKIEALTEGNAAVTKAIEALIGKGYSFGTQSMDNDLRVAAFLALESVVRGTKLTLSDDILGRFKNFLSRVDAAREDAAATIGKVPVQIIKINGHDDFVAKMGSRIVRWKQLPDAVMVPVATMMSLGSDSVVAGIGAVGTKIHSRVLDMDMVVMVDAMENL